MAYDSSLEQSFWNNILKYKLLISGGSYCDLPDILTTEFSCGEAILASHIFSSHV